MEIVEVLEEVGRINDNGKFIIYFNNIIRIICIFKWLKFVGSFVNIL